MCTYSMVAREWNTPGQPNYIQFTPSTPDPETAKRMLEILERLDEIDKKLGLKDCDDEAKEAIVLKLKLRADGLYEEVCE